MSSATGTSSTSSTARTSGFEHHQRGHGAGGDGARRRSDKLSDERDVGQQHRRHRRDHHTAADVRAQRCDDGDLPSLSLPASLPRPLTAYPLVFSICAPSKFLVPITDLVLALIAHPAHAQGDGSFKPSTQ